MHYVTHRIIPDAKTKVWRNMSRCAFSGIHTDPTRARKMAPQRFAPQTHRNALRDLGIQPNAKHMFRITCLGALLTESVTVSHEQEKWCIDVSRSEYTAMHYVTHRIPPDAIT
jgi:hypothetical protein